MSNITNPDAFQLEAAQILAAAYASFPMPIGWEHDEDTDEYPTETGQSKKDIQFRTIRWLTEHGYLDDEGGMAGGVWRGLLLGERGLQSLNAVPDALSGKEPLGKRLVNAVAKGSRDIIKQLIPVAIEEAMFGG